MIIDAHIHRGIMPAQYVYDTSLKTLLNTMDEIGISVAISSHCRSLVMGDMVDGTEISSKEYRESEGRIKSKFYYDPRKAEESIAVMERYQDDPAFCGIKIHPSWCWTSADDELYRPVWEYARKNGLPILSHSWDLSATNPKQIYSHPSRFEKYIAEYSDVKLVLAHSGGRYNAIKCACEIGKKYDNVYFDIAGDLYENGFIEYMVANVGSDRMMFGSDYSMMDQRTMLGVVMGAEITTQDRENILHNTAVKVYLGGACCNE